MGGLEDEVPEVAFIPIDSITLAWHLTSSVRNQLLLKQ